MRPLSRLFTLALVALVLSTLAGLLGFRVPGIVPIVCIATMVLTGVAYLVAILDTIAKGNR